jgi:molecular chaperone GrpE
MPTSKGKKNPLRSAAHAAKDLADTYKKNEPLKRKKIEEMEKEAEDMKKTEKPEAAEAQEQEVKSKAEETIQDTAENDTQEDAPKVEEKQDDSEVVAQLKDTVARKIAELENFRKRTQKEKLELIEYANSKLLFKLLDIKDDFENALGHSSKSSADDMLKGFEMINKKFSKIFEEFNVKEMESPVGQEFDVNMHEALMAQPSNEVEEGHIVQELQKGYTIGDKILRHAKVITSQG